MKNSEFEKQLAAQKFRPPPESWRAEILLQARLASASEESRPRSAAKSGGRESIPAAKLSWALAVRCVLRGFVRPSRQGWAGLGTAWILIFLLNYMAEKPASSETGIDSAMYSRIALSYYQNQRRMVELLNPEFLEPADRPKKSQPGPRSHSAPANVQV